MINTAIVGCNGKMGYFVAQAVQSREDCNVLFGVDAFGESKYDFDVYKTFEEATETPDVIIDFSNPAALDGMLSYAVENKVPCVICTTGFSKDQIAKIEDASKTIPVFYSALRYALPSSDVIHPDFCMIPFLSKQYNAFSMVCQPVTLFPSASK